MIDKEAAAGDVWQTIQKAAKKIARGPLRDRIESWETCPGYSEPGCDAEVVVLGDYNDPAPKPYDKHVEQRDRIKDLQKKISAMYKVEFEWCDEWTSCEDCRRAVRTSPNSYGWEPYFFILRDSEVYCIDCIKKSRELLEDTIAECRDNSKKCLRKFWNIGVSGLGYRKIPGTGFESGFHHGQNDDPKAILKAMKGKGYYCLFEIEDVRQFDMDFSLYIAREDESPVTDEDVKMVQEIMSKKENRETIKVEGKSDGTGDAARKGGSPDGGGCPSGPSLDSQGR